MLLVKLVMTFIKCVVADSSGSRALYAFSVLMQQSPVPVASHKFVPNATGHLKGVTSVCVP